MAHVNITKDLTEVKSKVVFGLTQRQLIFFALAALVAVPTYFLTRRVPTGQRTDLPPWSGKPILTRR